jgi:hypothetical protein
MRLLAAVERVERARRPTEGIAPVFERPREFAMRPPSQKEPAAIASLPPAGEAEGMPVAIAGSGSGLRRLASLATASINNTPWPPLRMASGPAPLPSEGAPPYDPPARAEGSPGGRDFARELAETLRAEAERHGIDTEGFIR